MVKYLLLTLILGVVLITGCASHDASEPSTLAQDSSSQDSLDADFDAQEFDDLEQMMQEFDDEFANDWQESDFK